MFLILLVATGAIWVSAFVWINQSTAQKMDRVLDARLAEAARMVSSLHSNDQIALESNPVLSDTTTGPYSRQLSCQIWRLDGTRVAGTSNAPAEELAAAEGFSTNTIDGEEWRVYSMVNKDLGVRVMIGDSMSMRKQLIRDVRRGLIVPALAILPVLAGLIWIGLGSGLRPLRRLAGDLAARDAEDLRPIDRAVPQELAPIQIAMNELFQRVEATRERERNFTAFAAHELKTPLAGLKTQAQIAVRGDDAQRLRALQHIQTSVARTDRLVRQLLEMAAVDARHEREDKTTLRQIVDDCIHMTGSLAQAKGVEVEVSMGDYTALYDRQLLGAAIRNLLENAIQASPEGSTVIMRAGANLVEVEDQGPGISSADRARISERFFRGQNTWNGGSGLGLAIVQAAMERLSGRLEFRAKADRGEIAALHLAP